MKVIPVRNNLLLLFNNHYEYVILNSLNWHNTAVRGRHLQHESEAIPFPIRNTHWKLNVQFMHGYINWYLWAFYFLLQSKSHHTDTVLMVAMPSGYDFLKIPLWCEMKEERASTSLRCTAGDRQFRFNDFSDFTLTFKTPLLLFW